MERVRTFAVQSGMVLRLEDIRSTTVVEAVDRSDIVITLEGDEELLEGLITELASPTELLIKENPRNGASVTIDGDSISVSGSFSGSVSIGSSSGIFGRHRGRGNRVVIDGVDVTDSIPGVHVTKVPVKITVSVPVGLDVEIGSCRDLNTSGPLGRARLRVGGQGTVVVAEVASLDALSKNQCRVTVKKVTRPTQLTKLRAIGQSTLEVNGNLIDLELASDGQADLRVTGGSGNVVADSSGQSDLEVTGAFADLELTSGDQSTLRVNGNCVNLTAESSGQSDIIRRGEVSGKCRERSSGQSSIR